MKKTISLILFIIQSLLVIACITGAVFYFLGYKWLLDIIMLVLACDLVVLGLNNLLLVKNKKYALIYLIVGGIMLLGVILKMVGVHF